MVCGEALAKHGVDQFARRDSSLTRGFLIRSNSSGANRTVYGISGILLFFVSAERKQRLHQ